VAGAEASLFEAGLYGAMMFAITALLRLLAQRLAAQEQLAQQRGRNLHNQLAINRLVIAQLEQGVVVVDADARVRANNRAARVLFGMKPEAQLTGERLSSFERLVPLVSAFRRWRDTAPQGDTGASSVVELPELRLRARLVQPSAVQSDEFLIFIEDQRAIDERAQQLKLASMGRLTASIAHEIRNPLAAISHASQLLVEDAGDAGLKRLASIVRENTLRLNRLVDDILRVARREAPLGDDIELVRFLPEWLDEFVRDRPQAQARVVLDVPAGARVKFERSHLRQVLFNLLDNALRYASGDEGAVRVFVDERGAAAVLWVIDDGPGVAESVRASLLSRSTRHTWRGPGSACTLRASSAWPTVPACLRRGDAARWHPSPWLRRPLFRGRRRTAGLGLSRYDRTPMSEPRPAAASDAAHERRAPAVLVVDDEADLRELLSLTLGVWASTSMPRTRSALPAICSPAIATRCA